MEPLERKIQLLQKGGPQKQQKHNGKPKLQAMIRSAFLQRNYRLEEMRDYNRRGKQQKHWKGLGVKVLPINVSQDSFT